MIITIVWLLNSFEVEDQSSRDRAGGGRHRRAICGLPANRDHVEGKAVLEETKRQIVAIANCKCRNQARDLCYAAAAIQVHRRHTGSNFQPLLAFF